MAKPVVLASAPPVFERRGAYFEVLSNAGFEVRFPNPGGRKLTEAELLANLVGVEAVLSGPEVYSRAVLRACPTLRVLARCGVGFDNYDVPAATELGIAVGYAPGANHEAVGEHAIGMMLALSREFFFRDSMVRAGGFKRNPVRPLRGKTLGIIGFGRTGSATARRAHGFGMTMLATDPVPNEPLLRELGVSLVSLEDLLTQSDVVSIHCPLTPLTRGMIGEPQIAKMKNGAILIHTSRGGILDESALASALHAGKIAAAGIDVFANEPPIGSPLLSAPNTLLTPHIAGIDVASIENMALFAAEVIVDLHAGRWPRERLINGDEIMPWRW